ncbi:MAG: YcaO-related McrA-glycine thioamidation protein [Methanomicrobiales archaeon]|nr:YcaO-related McrA-glycine thioamidation protein [Methanomicrobiales archaeon]
MSPDMPPVMPPAMPPVMPFTLARGEKRYFTGTHRTRTPEETLTAVAPLMEDIGVTEVVDLTPLDRLGIPCFAAMRPSRAWGSVQIHPGKGADPLQARVSAMMEAVERFSAEYRADPMQIASYEEIGVARAVDPQDLILPRRLAMGEKVHWTEGWDLLNEEPVWVPANAVFYPYDSRGMVTPLFRPDPNGLGAGNTREEAILHGLLEVVERDALSVATQANRLGKRLVLPEGGIARGLLDRCLAAGLAVHLWLVPGRTRVPVVAAAADDPVARDPALLVTGSGAHTDPEIAAIRALTELANSRVIHFHGEGKNPGRQEMVQRIGYDRLKRVNRAWFAVAEEIPLGQVPGLATDTIDGDIRAVMRELEEQVPRICICDLNRTGIPVVRVVVPGMEVSHLNVDRSRSAVAFSGGGLSERV